MQVNIDLPEDISQALRKQWGDLPHHTLETWAIEGYKSGVLTEGQVRRMLNFETRIEVHEFLKNARVYLDYTEDDLEQDVETHRKLGILPAR